MASDAAAVRPLALDRLIGSLRWYHLALTAGVVGLLAGPVAAVPEVGAALASTGAIWTRPDLLALFFVSYSAAFAPFAGGYASSVPALALPLTALDLAVATHAVKFAFAFAVGLPCLLARAVAAGIRRR